MKDIRIFLRLYYYTWNRMRYIYLILVFLITLAGVAQERDLVQGKIVSRSRNLEGIYVSNVNTGEAVLTSKGGYFDIEAQMNDTLMFSGALFIGYRRALDDIDFKREILLIPLEENDLMNQLDEIIITKITSESLGLVPKGIKKYTPAERRLYTATSGGGLIPIDMIVNAITGRTKMLKKALQYEKQEMRKEKLSDYFSVEYIVNNFNIPEKYGIGFMYYSVSDEEVISLLGGKNVNKVKLEERLGGLALSFLDLISDKDNVEHVKVIEE
ncbi:hypothetical protein SAMN04487893_11942 [Myroides guanonis]|uniref:CarboxypepD_reg-like domain-containing protein n=2 Tax=Myroides guanonis TaxID=1150112 RepID=A0A1I3URC3_9FLAO|nr:hypothetical protein SAMN04487893_11942 [Myroides guanonis]